MYLARPYTHNRDFWAVYYRWPDGRTVPIGTPTLNRRRVIATVNTLNLRHAKNLPQP